MTKRDKSINMLIEWFSNMILFTPIQSYQFSNNNCNDQILAEDGNNFSNWLKNILNTEPDFYIPLTKTLSQVIPDFNKIHFISNDKRDKRDKRDKNNIQIKFANNKKQMTLDFIDLSDGEKMTFIISTIMCWAEYSDKTSFVFIDEPINYIGYDIAEIIIQNFIKKTKNNSVQLLITSKQRFNNIQTFQI